MTTALELITRSLRLINQPGRGSQLSAADQSGAFEALQELLDSESVSKQFVPGIRQHFFTYDTPNNQFTYGAGAGFALNCAPFGLSIPDPAPVRLETAFFRSGSSITDNELIAEYRFETDLEWIAAGTADITNNQLDLVGIGSVNQLVPGADLSGATTYTLRVNCVVNLGTAQIRIVANSIDLETYVFDSSGNYEFDFVWRGDPDAEIFVETLDAGDDVSFTQVSVVERGKQRLELPQAQGTDYPIRLIDQDTYELQSVKGQGGQLYQAWYTRQFDQSGLLRFDSTAQPGAIIVMDVLVNTVQVTDINQQLRVNPEAIKWLRFALADSVAGEYGKSLNARQLRLMDMAWDRLSSSNRRINKLRVDRGLQATNVQRYSINRGDY
jgi:hypothetical protein